MERQKRIMAINDISCFGKCSLTVALPILSASGVEACPVPTALLSTHTGEGFSGYTFKNLEDQIMPVTEHWKRLDINFDAIYSGYLGSFEQIKCVEKIIDNFRKDNVTVLVDPVMGDNGKLYAGFDKKFARGMLELCKKADIIVPNITEVSYMLETEYKEIFSVDDIYALFDLFRKNGINKVVITGIHMENDVVVCAVLDGDETYFVKNNKISGMYHGTGDVFASVLLGAYEKGKTLKESVELAAWFVYECIMVTKKRHGEYYYGVDFESILGKFIERLQ